MVTAVATANWSWAPYLAVVYVVGATINHALFLAIHELAHNLGFKKPNHNRYFAMFANIPIAIPYCIAFKGYHIEHHKYQGVDGIDTDVPTALEGRVFKGKFMKFLFCFSQILFYAFRPMLVKFQEFTMMHAINWGFTFGVDALIIALWGWRPMLYFLLCLFLAGSIHPTAGHFIAEHYVFNPGQETYSYYGPLNWLTFNVGYHNEHHDFPFIPGSRLPQLKAIAPEFHDERAGLGECESWPMVIFNYIMRDDMGPYARAKRHPKAAKSD